MIVYSTLHHLPHLCPSSLSSLPSFIGAINAPWVDGLETKSKAIYKLNQAELIGIHPQEPGKSVRVFRPDIKGEYDDR